MNTNATELAFVRGSVFTVNGRDEIAEAMAVRGDRIAFVGSTDQVLAHVGEGARIVDLAGVSVIPGFVDNHIHMTNSYQRHWIDCSYPRCRSIEDIRDLLADATRDRPVGSWILGRGFDPARLTEGRPPNRHDLDPIAREFSVGICNREGMGWTFNTLGLRAIGVEDDTPDPPGGPLDRDSRGVPLGPMWDNARTVFVNPHLPQPTDDDIADGYGWIEERLLEVGVTTAFEAGYREARQARGWQVLRQTRNPRVRIHLGPYPLHGASWNEDGAPGCLFRSGVATGFGDAWLRIGALQMGVDGGLVGRTAALLEPYTDGPAGFRGSFRATQETLSEAVRRASRAGWQVGLICQGDAGIARALTAIADGGPASGAPRHRLEHAYVWAPELLDRMAELGVIWNTQAQILPLTGGQLAPMLGPRVRWAFPFRSILERGITVSGGSDWSVGPLNPFLGIDAMVHHRSDFGPDASPLVADETVSLQAALRAHTMGGAIAGGQDRDIGSIEAGKLADFVVVDRDLTEVQSGYLGDVRVSQTYVGGNLAFSSQ